VLTPGLVDQSQTSGQSQLFATIAASQIVKTGQMTLEVSDLEAAIGQATDGHRRSGRLR